MRATCPTHLLPSFDHHKNIWWSVHVMKLHIMQSSPVSRPLDPNILLLNALFSSTLNLYFSPWQTKFLTLQTSRQNYGFVYFTLWIFWKGMGRQQNKLPTAEKKFLKLTEI
jgi:hypothetical protein